ncbi:MAG: GNAT family N-acetyltransferase [Alteromonadaceae bacterium]|nr:GNAT family N-acetyltransferase [Alteromonadaceae bacterium]
MITLRPFITQDIPALLTILNDTDVVKYLSTRIPFPYTQADALWWINQGSQHGVIRAIDKDGELAGCIGVTPGEFEYQRNGEIGYWLAKAYWRQGFASLAIEKIIDITFATTDIERIFATVFEANEASKQLLLKCGFAPEAVLGKAIYKNGVFYDSHIFARFRPS